MHVFCLVLTDFPLFGNAVYGCLMTGSNDDQFCLQLGKSKFCFWILSFLYVGFKNDFLQVCDLLTSVMYMCSTALAQYNV